MTIEERRDFLLRHHIALWDVVATCDIQGSADSTMRKVVPNDLSEILSRAEIRQIFVNGKTAAYHYHRLIEPVIARPAIPLPSTSPANAACSMEDLLSAWRVILDDCK